MPVHTQSVKGWELKFPDWRSLGVDDGAADAGCSLITVPGIEFLFVDTRMQAGAAVRRQLRGGMGNKLSQVGRVRELDTPNARVARVHVKEFYHQTSAIETQRSCTRYDSLS